MLLGCILFWLVKQLIALYHMWDWQASQSSENGAMVFGRVHVGRVKFGSMSLWSPLNRFECLVALKFDRVHIKS